MSFIAVNPIGGLEAFSVKGGRKVRQVPVEK